MDLPAPPDHPRGILHMGAGMSQADEKAIGDERGHRIAFGAVVTGIALIVFHPPNCPAFVLDISE